MSKVSEDTPVEGVDQGTSVELDEPLLSVQEVADLEAKLENTQDSQPDAKEVVEEKVVEEVELGDSELAVDDTDEGDASETEGEAPQKLTATDMVGLSWDEVSELEADGAEFDEGAAKLYKSMKKAVNQKFEENATIRKELEEHRRVAAEERRLAAEERQRVLDTLGKVESDKRIAAEEAMLADMPEEDKRVYRLEKRLEAQQAQIEEQRKLNEQQSMAQYHQNIHDRVNKEITELGKAEPTMMKKFGKKIRKEAYQAVFEIGDPNRPAEDIAKQVFGEWQEDLSPDSMKEVIKDDKYATLRTADTKAAAKKLIAKSGKKKKATTMRATRSGEPPKKKQEVKEVISDRISLDLQDEFKILVDEVNKHGGFKE